MSGLPYQARPKERLRELLTGLTQRQWLVQVERCGGGREGEGGELTLPNFKRMLLLSVRRDVPQWGDHEIAELWQYLQSHAIAGEPGSRDRTLSSQSFLRFLQLHDLVAARVGESEHAAAGGPGGGTAWREVSSSADGSAQAKSWKERAENLKLLTRGGSAEANVQDEMLERARARERARELERVKDRASEKEAEWAAKARVSSGVEEDRWVDKHGRVLSANELLERARRRLAASKAASNEIDGSYDASHGASVASLQPRRKTPVKRRQAAIPAAAANSHTTLNPWTHRDQSTFRYVSCRRSPAFAERYSPQVSR